MDDPLVTVIGDLVEDVVVWPDGPTDRGTDNPALIRRSCGGSGANVAAAVAATGTASRFIGRVGDDATGVRLAQELGDAGVDARVQRGGRTGCVVVLVHADGERTMFPDRGAAAELGPIDDADLAGTTVLHLPLYGFLDARAAAHLARAASYVRADGGTVTVDLSATSAIEHLGAVAVGVLLDDVRPAVVLANRSEAAAAALPADGGRYLQIVKAGADAATIIHPDGHRETVAPASRVTARDTTGAGDAFAGAFLACWAAGALPADACAAGHRTAAATLTVAGAR